MIQHFPCPGCNRSLFFSDAKKSEAACLKCSHRYILELATLEHFSTRIKARQNTRWAREGAFSRQRCYSLRLSNGDGLKSIQISVPAERPRIEAVPGDRLALLYICTQQHSHKLVQLKNLATDIIYPLKSPYGEIRTLSTRIGILIFCSGFILSLGFGGVSARIIQITSFPLALGAGYWVRRKSQNDLKDESVGQHLYATQQTLLKKLHTVEQKVAQIQSVQQTSQVLSQQLRHHRQAPISLGKERYQQQLDVIARGEIILKKQLQLSGHLLEQYRRAIAFVETEMMAGHLASQLPAGIMMTQHLWSELDALDAIEQQLLELEEALLSSGIENIDLLSSI